MKKKIFSLMFITLLYSKLYANNYDMLNPPPPYTVETPHISGIMIFDSIMHANMNYLSTLWSEYNNYINYYGMLEGDIGLAFTEGLVSLIKYGKSQNWHDVSITNFPECKDYYENGYSDDAHYNVSCNLSKQNSEQLISFLKKLETENKEAYEVFQHKLVEVLASTAKYESFLKEEPLEFQLHHSNTFSSTILSWNDMSEQYSCPFFKSFYISGHISTITGVDYVNASPSYKLYRVVNGVETLISEIKLTQKFAGTNSIGITLGDYSKNWFSNLSDFYSFFTHKDNTSKKKISFIDNLSEQYLGEGQEIFYRLVSQQYIAGVACGNQDSYNSEIFFDEDADGQVDFASKKFRQLWLIPILTNLIIN